MEIEKMPRTIEQVSIRISSLFEREMYAEVIECTTATERSLYPFRGNPPKVTTTDLTLLANTMLAKCVAYVHLKQYGESRVAARKAFRMMWLLGVRSRRADAFSRALTVNLNALYALVNIRSSLQQWRSDVSGDMEK